MNWSHEEYQEYLKKKGIKTVDEKKPLNKSKYHNKYTWIDGVCFHSSQEAKYYMNLKLLLKVGGIKGFCRQPEFVLVEGNEEDRAITYSADFIIFHNDGTYEIVDVKGFESEQWERTFKQFRLKYPNLKLNVVKE